MRTVEDVVRELLAHLPKCHACEGPATRSMVSKQVPSPTQFSIPGPRGKSFTTIPGAMIKSETMAGGYPSGMWTWDCCDDHSMPPDLAAYSRDVPTAAATRDALAFLNPKGSA